jgi:hypothetical protein
VVPTSLLPALPCFRSRLFAVALGVLCWREVFKCWRVIFLCRRFPASVPLYRCCDVFILSFLYFWAFCFMYLLSILYGCYPKCVWIGFIRTLSTPCLTSLTGGMCSWYSCQESIWPCHSFDAFSLNVCFLWCLLLGCPTLICCF